MPRRSAPSAVAQLELRWKLRLVNDHRAGERLCDMQATEHELRPARGPLAVDKVWPRGARHELDQRRGNLAVHSAHGRHDCCGCRQNAGQGAGTAAAASMTMEFQRKGVPFGWAASGFGCASFA